MIEGVNGSEALTAEPLQATNIRRRLPEPGVSPGQQHEDSPIRQQSPREA